MRLENTGLPPTRPSRDCTPPDAPSSADRCPPAEEPHEPKRERSSSYALALARSRRTAPFISLIYAVNVTGSLPYWPPCDVRRYSTLATAKPAFINGCAKPAGKREPPDQPPP